MLLLPVINSELLPETNGKSEYNANFRYYSTENAARALLKYEESSDFKINAIPQSRRTRQAQNFFQHKPSGYSNSHSNKLNTHGIAITGNVGIGVRYASGNNYNGGGHSQQNHQESSSNIFDRYFGTTFNVGTNLHLANDENNQAQQHETIGNVGNVPKDEDSIKRLGFDNSTTRQNTLWNRLSHYFSRAKSPEGFNGTIVDCDGTEEYENCTEVAASNSALTRFIGRYFTKNEPRKVFAENETVPEIHTYIQRRVLNDLDSNHTDTSVFNRIAKYFSRYKFPSIIDQIWNDRNNIDANRNNSSPIKSDYEGFRTTVKEFLVDRISSYVSQNTTNENFIQKIIKKSLSQIVNEPQTQQTKEHSPIEQSTFRKQLSEYFTNERFKSFFPDIETIKNNIANPHWFEYESGFVSGWLKNNLPSFMNKHFNGN